MTRVREHDSPHPALALLAIFTTLFLAALPFIGWIGLISAFVAETTVWSLPLSLSNSAVAWTSTTVIVFGLVWAIIGGQP